MNIHNLIQCFKLGNRKALVFFALFFAMFLEDSTFVLAEELYQNEKNVQGLYVTDESAEGGMNDKVVQTMIAGGRISGEGELVQGILTDFIRAVSKPSDTQQLGEQIKRMIENYNQKGLGKEEERKDENKPEHEAVHNDLSLGQLYGVQLNSKTPTNAFQSKGEENGGEVVKASNQTESSQKRKKSSVVYFSLLSSLSIVAVALLKKLLRKQITEEEQDEPVGDSIWLEMLFPGKS